jgi:hypothetical protein
MSAVTPTTRHGIGCDGACDNDDAPVAFIDHRGFGYCVDCGPRARSYWTKVRKLRPHEVRKLRRGEQLARY